MWSIRVLSGRQTGQVYDLKLGKNIFGRDGQSDFKIKSLGISKEHCEIHVYKDKMMIVDLKSSNGTFVNGVKIQNSIIRIGDKISLFDVILDIIPSQDIRPKSTQKRPQPAVQTVPRVADNHAINYPLQGNSALQMSHQSYPQPLPSLQQSDLQQLDVQNRSSQSFGVAADAPQVSLQQKIENYIENVVMPAVYKLAIVFSFKQILQTFIIIFIFAVTILSTFPLMNIIKESSLNESIKRAKSVARAVAKFNEQALLSGQLANLSVQEALKEEGIKEAFIVQHSDGLVVAPPEKVGHDDSNPLILTARKESRAAFAKIDANTIGASFPIAVYDPLSGEAAPKYHAIVTYDVSSLNFDEGKMVSLFMQTLIISTVLGLILYYLFVRLIEFPIKTLNHQIDKALLEKSDRTEVAFDYPVFQKLVANVNTILNRAWSGSGLENAMPKPQQNKDIEFTNLVEIISHPAIVVDVNERVIALNSGFELLAQINKDVLNQSYQQGIMDHSLVQNMESLIARSRQSPYEKQMDKIPFAQFECEIFCQAFLDSAGEPQYFILTLMQMSGQ